MSIESTSLRWNHLMRTPGGTLVRVSRSEVLAALASAVDASAGADEEATSTGMLRRLVRGKSLWRQQLVSVSPEGSRDGSARYETRLIKSNKISSYPRTHVTFTTVTFTTCTRSEHTRPCYGQTVMRTGGLSTCTVRPYTLLEY